MTRKCQKGVTHCPSCGHPAIISKEKGPTQDKVRSALGIPPPLSCSHPWQACPRLSHQKPWGVQREDRKVMSLEPRPWGHPPSCKQPPMLLQTPEEFCTKSEAVCRWPSKARLTMATRPTPLPLTPGPPDTSQLGFPAPQTPVCTPHPSWPGSSD